jgi:hypothetical protein
MFRYLSKGVAEKQIIHRISSYRSIAVTEERLINGESGFQQFSSL